MNGHINGQRWLRVLPGEHRGTACTRPVSLSQLVYSKAVSKGGRLGGAGWGLSPSGMKRTQDRAAGLHIQHLSYKHGCISSLLSSRRSCDRSCVSWRLRSRTKRLKGRRCVCSVRRKKRHVSLCRTQTFFSSLTRSAGGDPVKRLRPVIYIAALRREGATMNICAKAAAGV